MVRPSRGSCGNERFVGRPAAASILEDLAKGREPGSFALEGGFTKLGLRAEHVATEHEHLRRQRQLAEANLQIILSSMQEGVMVVDSRRSIRLVNPSLRKMFDLSSTIFGHPVMDTLREPQVDNMIMEAMATGEPQESEIELAARKPPVMLMVNVSPMRDAAGEAGALAMFRDVTRLTQLEQVRREFVANVSHELRTPLAIFQGYVENLVDNPDTPLEERTARTRCSRNIRSVSMRSSRTCSFWRGWKHAAMK